MGKAQTAGRTRTRAAKTDLDTSFRVQAWATATDRSEEKKERKKGHHHERATRRKKTSRQENGRAVVTRTVRDRWAELGERLSGESKTRRTREREVCGIVRRWHGEFVYRPPRARSRDTRHDTQVWTTRHNTTRHGTRARERENEQTRGDTESEQHTTQAKEPSQNTQLLPPNFLPPPAHILILTLTHTPCSQQQQTRGAREIGRAHV